MSQETEQAAKNAKAREREAAAEYHAKPTNANYRAWEAAARDQTTAVEVHRTASFNAKLAAHNETAAQDLAEKQQAAEEESARRQAEFRSANDLVGSFRPRSGKSVAEDAQERHQAAEHREGERQAAELAQRQARAGRIPGKV
jgi:hypothetical protein